MKLQIQKYNVPEKISFNYEELKYDLIAKTEKYQTLVYEEEQIKEAKTDKANLNKLKKSLNDERIRQEKEYMKPFSVFKEQVKEITNIIDSSVSNIDKQVKAYEEKMKLAKREKIKVLYSNMNHPVFLTIDMIFKDKWLNASFSMKAVEDDIQTKLIEVKKDIKTIESLPEFGFEAMEVYKQTLNINRAIAEGKRIAEIQKRKEETVKSDENQDDKTEALKVIEKKEEVELPFSASGVRWVRFEAFVTDEDIEVMKKFFDTNLIEVRML